MVDKKIIKTITVIPGVGKSIARNLWEIGIRDVSDLSGQNPELLYDLSNKFSGIVQDRCLLYVFRCAVYYANTSVHDQDPEKLKWWNWKDKKKFQMKKLRLDHELPISTGDWGWKYHHLGIPTKKRMPGETYLPKFKFYVSGFNRSPFGIEWMRFEKDSPVSKLIQTVPHLAFEVKDINHELATHDFNVISEPESNFDGITVAMIEHNGAPVELIKFEKNK